MLASGCLFILFFILFVLTHGLRPNRIPNNVLNFNKKLLQKNNNDHDRGPKKLKPRSATNHHSNDINQPSGLHHFYNHVSLDDQSSLTKHSCESIRSVDHLYNEAPHKNLQHFYPYPVQRSKKQKQHNRRRRHQQKLLKKFYDKYTEAYGILVLSPKSVPDSALKRACYVLRFLLADRTDQRIAFKRRKGRVVVLGRNHYIADLPEYKLFLQQQKHHPQQQRVKQILKRFKNVPSNRIVGITTTTEENLLCYKNFSNLVTEVNFVEDVFNQNQTDKSPNHASFPLNASYRVVGQHHHRRTHQESEHWNRHNCHHGRHKHPSDKPCRSHRRAHLSRDDITLKSLAIGILNLAVPETNPSLLDRLEKAYKHALLTGLWLNTDAASDVQSYFGEGVQSYYNANAYARPANGFNNEVNSRVKLKSHDPELYAIVHEVFPCANNYVKRCGSRGNEAKLFFEMDCPIHRWKEK